MFYRTLVLTCILYSSNVIGVLFNDTKYVHETLINFYSNNNKSLTSVIPLADLSRPIPVELTLCLYSVDGFDAVTGQVAISGSVYMEWLDETRSASIGNFDFSNYDVGYSVTISPNAIWTPSLVLLNAVDGVRNVGDQAYNVRYLVSDGRAKWQPRVVIQASCTPNVKYYPFDQQDCNFVYTAWGYTTSELILENAQDDWFLCDYTPNAVWSLVKTSAEVYVKNDQSFVKFEFTIQRQPKYFVINVICPIVLLSFLDGFVFLMPADSGERIGFSVTCFLSFIFMLQSVMSFLPHTAEPMSILCFYVVVMMIASIFQCIITVMTLRIHHTPESSKVPNSIKTLVRVVTLVWVGPLWQILKNTCRKSQTAHIDNPSNGNGAETARSSDTMANSASANSINLMVNSPRLTSARKQLGAEHSFSLNQPGSSVSSGDSPSYLLFRSDGSSSGSQSASTRVQSGTSNGQDNTDKKEPEINWPVVARALDIFFFYVFIAFQLICTLLFIVPLSGGG